jgi:type IV pilus assembly protein PilY1
VYSSNANYASYHYTGGTTSVSTTPTNSCAGTQVSLNWVNTPGGTCANDNDGSIQYTCDGNSTTWSCRETANSYVTLKYENTNRPYPRRFYGVWTYGKSADGVSADRVFNSDTEATNYDNMRFTDSDLKDVTNFNTAGVVTNSSVEASASGKGWYVEYAGGDERTGGTGALVNGCMVWGSFEPSGNAGVVCSTTGTNKARLYQSHFSTGRANCAAGFYNKSTDTWARYIEFTTVAATPEPVVQLTLANGSLDRTLTLIGAGLTGGGGGGPPTGTSGTASIGVRSTSDGVKSLYQIELDRRAHDCRHEGIQSACD